MGLLDFKNKKVSGYFEENRYDVNSFFDAWIRADKSKKVIVVNDIEVEQYDPEYENRMEIFWKKLSDIDNRVLQYCREECEKSDFDEKNFVVDLNWVLMEGDNIELGYVGRFVNIELRATLNDHLDIIEIYYQ